MGYTYPAPAPSISGDIVTISRFLNDPALVARRLATLAQQRYIADAILTGRFQVSGGSIQYESGESIFTADNPRAVAPGGEYPLTTLGSGTPSLAKTVKWGQDVIITDEAIARQKMDPVNRGLSKLVNQNVKHVDTVAMSAVASAVTSGIDAAVAWSTATGAQILKDVMLAKAEIAKLNQGFSPDTVVVDDVNWACAMAAFVAAGFVPREGNNNPALTGEFPVIAGLRWLATPNGIADSAIVLDSTQLGGMADEELSSPGYAKAAGTSVETKSIRDDDNDQWKLRARRVTVPVVLEPGAGRLIKDLDGSN